MSCTVIAVPLALHYIIGTIVASTAVGAMALNQVSKTEDFVYENDTVSEVQDDFYKNLQNMQVKDIVEKEFETAYMDKNILIKTLEEHGVVNIQEEYEGKITGIVDNFNLTFEKPFSDKPYNLKISCREQDCAEEKLNDLNSEYALNVQEDAYLNLIENLKANNMEVENEVVEDDNTIVLTINLE